MSSTLLLLNNDTLKPICRRGKYFYEIIVPLLPLCTAPYVSTLLDARQIAILCSRPCATSGDALIRDDRQVSAEPGQPDRVRWQGTLHGGRHGPDRELVRYPAQNFQIPNEPNLGPRQGRGRCKLCCHHSWQLSLSPCWRWISPSIPWKRHHLHLGCWFQ